MVILAVSGTIPAGVAKAGGDPEAGRTASAACAGCHGPDGMSPIPGTPHLAGLPETYVVNQLRAFKEGRRSDPIMMGMAAALTDTAMADIGAWYAGLMPGAGGPPDEQAKLIAEGERVYFHGNADTGLAACVGCHGRDGRGLPKEPSIPPLRGQRADYVAKMLTAFKGGLRSNDAEEMMRRIAERMDEREISATAAYVQALGRR